MPLNLHLDIFGIETNKLTDVISDVDGHLNCKSCNYPTSFSLPSKNNTVQKFLRKFVTPNRKAWPETVNCKKCEKPSNIDNMSIYFHEYDNRHENNLQGTFKCKSCKKENIVQKLSYKSEHIQKSLLKLCN